MSLLLFQQNINILAYKLAAPRIVFVFASICHAITDPPVTKIWLWVSFGVSIRTKLWTF